jgi:hypothetical protein
VNVAFATIAMSVSNPVTVAAASFLSSSPTLKTLTNNLKPLSTHYSN